ncbi:MAG: DNA double-strand break repair nuclease NurA [Candidatus Ranarchaeia archaeon]
MLIDSIKGLIEKLDKKINEDNLGMPFFGNIDHTIKKIEKSNFNPINEIESDKRIAFIDGGNLEILGGANFSIQVNRVGFNIFNGKERIKNVSTPQQIEFFSATYSSFRENDIYYDTIVIPTNEKHKDLLPRAIDLSFSSKDRTLMHGNQRADLVIVASMARRFAEWAFATKIVEKELEKDEVIVIDGTLQSAFTNESYYLTRLYKKAKMKEVIVSGLAKTSKLYTNTGLPLLGAVTKYANDNQIPHKAWYIPIAEINIPDHNVVIFITKLHEATNHVYRFEIQKEIYDKITSKEMKEIMFQISQNSSDFSLPGYPYGLIDADKIARVRYDEINHYKSMLLSEISRIGKAEKFAKYVKTTDTHNILNRLVRD